MEGTAYKPRERNEETLWVDKKIIRFFRKTFNKANYKKLRNVYIAMIEIDSDFVEERESETKAIHNFTEKLCTYAGMDQGTVTPIARIIKTMGLVDYGIKKGTTGIIGSYLILYEWEGEEYAINALIKENPYKGSPLDIKNILTPVAARHWLNLMQK